MKTTYFYATGEDDFVGEVQLSESEWFKVFISGCLHGKPLTWIERKDDPSKRVSFAENANGAQSS